MIEMSTDKDFKGRPRGYNELPDNERVYMINGLKYRFTSVHMEHGKLRGYCPKVKKWANLYSDYICFDGTYIGLRDPKN